MARALGKVVLGFFLAVLLGCGGDKEKGINKDRDKPRKGTQSKDVRQAVAYLPFSAGSSPRW
jgi:hypothetical protein